ncbi:MAG: TRAP transporter small permease [Desulfovibrio sp.]|nr:TRAP transporter small permease [Desulfovibrio sp.]MBI4958711.1 TRAP transporter small permease [Desulfovibrio sp.]
MTTERVSGIDATNGGLAFRVDRMANRLCKGLEWACGLCIAAMVVIVWLGAFSRYFFDLGFTWTEELSRYVMIWGSLLAVPVAAYHREHIGLDLLFKHFPPPMKRAVRFLLDFIGLAFFLFLTWFGIGMTMKGASQYATIFHMSMAFPFASIPVTSFLTALMIAASMLVGTAGLPEPEQHSPELLND